MVGNMTTTKIIILKKTEIAECFLSLTSLSHFIFFDNIINIFS